MDFKPYDPDGETRRSRQNLPHWNQAGVTYFVTSRLRDSMPQSALDQWQQERHEWLRTRGIERIEQVPDLPQEIRHEFHRRFTTWRTP